MSIFCEQCGKQATTSSNFCIDCGTPFSLGNDAPTAPNARPDAYEASAFDEAVISGKYVDLATLTDVSARRTIPFLTAALIAIGVLVVGLAAGLAMREMGSLDFVLGEKISLDVATVQAESAYSTGYQDGETQGTKTGDEAGYERGNEAGYNRGYELGNDEGYNRGYDSGVDVGFIDAKTGITPTNLGYFGLTASWRTDVGPSPGSVCLFSNGSNLPKWQRLKWAFISPSGSINFLSGTNDDYNCWSSDQIASNVGSRSQYSRLAIYLTVNGKTDRWGPLPIPTP